MNIEQFTKSLDQYGAQIESWPESEAAKKLLLKSVQAQKLLHTVAAIEQAVQSSTVIAPAGLQQRILAQLPDPPMSIWQELAALLRIQRPWVPITTAVLPLILGFVFGIASPETKLSSENDDAHTLWIFGDSLEHTNMEFADPQAIWDEERTL